MSEAEGKILRELEKGPRSPTCLIKKLKVGERAVKVTLKDLEERLIVDKTSKTTANGQVWNFYHLRPEAKKQNSI